MLPRQMKIVQPVVRIGMMRIVLFALICASARAVEFKNCGSTAGNYDKIEISDCDMSAPSCVLKKGKEVSLGLHFTPSKSCSRVTTVVHGLIDDLDVPFPIPHAEACFDEHSGVICPLAENTGTSYHATLPVLTKYPTVSLTVRWELKDEKGDDIVCVEIPVSIK